MNVCLYVHPSVLLYAFLNVWTDFDEFFFVCLSGICNVLDHAILFLRTIFYFLNGTIGPQN